mmetsp:Transcript_12968/g.33100  ORF Transcript_12968/g.33100 Transcript_12968/m.33100 type:complete len:239 (+) Transcript_12968:61-777(+)
MNLLSTCGTKHKHIMTSYLSSDGSAEGAHLGMCPQVTHRHCGVTGPAELRPLQSDAGRRVRAVRIEEDHGHAAVVQGLGPSLCVIGVLEQLIAGRAQWVLVHCDHLVVGDQTALLLAQMAQIGGHQERCRPQGPEAHLHPGHVVGHRHREEGLQEVRIHVAVRFHNCRWLESCHVADDIVHTLAKAFASRQGRKVPERNVIHLDAEHLANVCTPAGHIFVAPVAEREENRTTGSVQCL